MSSIFVIDLDTVAEPQTHQIILSEQLCNATAVRFKIPTVLNVEIIMNIQAVEHYWVLTGQVNGAVQLKCVQSKELFEDTFAVPFDVILSHLDMEDETLDIELLETSQIDIGDIALQYLALSIPLTPIHPKISAITDNSIPSVHEDDKPEWKKALTQINQKK